MNVSKRTKWILGNCLLPRGSKSSSVSLYDLRFLRYWQSKFWASDNGEFSRRTSQNGFWPIAYYPQGRNRAPFHSTIDGFRDIVNQSFGRVIMGDFHDEPLKTGKMAFQQLHIAHRVEIELRFALRSTVSEITAIKVLML